MSLFFYLQVQKIVICCSKGRLALKKQIKILSMPEFLHLLLLQYRNNAIYKMTNIKHLKDGMFFSAIFRSFQHFQQCTF